MIKNRLYILFFVLTLVMTAFAQGVSRTSISGIVVDAENGETLPFVQVYFLRSTTNKGLVASEVGTTTDMDGNFSLSNTAGYTVVKIDMVGYKTETITLTKGQSKTKAKILLIPDVYGLQEVIITPPKSKKKVCFWQLKAYVVNTKSRNFKTKYIWLVEVKHRTDG